MKSIKTFVRENGITIENDWADSNPNMEKSDWSRGATHWECTLKMGRRRMKTYFSQGSAHTNEPSAEDVLDCLASDASGAENARSFEDWCGDYGYDTDSRSAERTYQVIQKQAKELRKFLGDALYETLLWNTERQ